MADATVKGNASRKSRSTFKSIIVPILIGAIVGIFFLHFVPQMIGHSLQDVPLHYAAIKSFESIVDEYNRLLTSHTQSNLRILIWPAAGAVIYFFVSRLYQD